MSVVRLPFLSYSKWLTFGTLFYLLVPFLLFLTGWIRPIYGLPACFLLLVCAYQTFKQTKRILIVTPSCSALLAILFLTLLWCFRAGLGEWTPQSSDFIKHNLVFADLVKFSWPVRYIQEPDQPFLCYYLAYYLPIALVAKLLGINSVPILSFTWSAAGLYFFFNWVLVIARQYWLGAILGFTLLSGFRALNHLFIYSIQFLNKNLFGEKLQLFTRDTNNLNDISFSSHDIVRFTHNIDQWVYTPNQALGGWLAVAWIYVLLQNRLLGSILFISALTLFYSPFSVLGFLILIVAYWPPNWRDFISVPNLIGSAIVCFFLLSYYLAHYPLNASGWNLPNTPGKVIHDLNLIVTDIVLPFGVVWWLYYQFRVLTAQQFNFMLLVSIVKLLCIFFYVGYNSDLLQRLLISLSSLFYIFMGIAIQKAAQQPHFRLKMSLLFVALVILSFRPIHILFIQWKYVLFDYKMQPMQIGYLNKHYRSVNEINKAVFRDYAKYRTYDYKFQYLGNRHDFFGRFLMKPDLNSE